MKHKWITCLTRLQPALYYRKAASFPFNNNRQLKTELLYRKKKPQMRIHKSALRVISTNELAFMTLGNASL